MSIGGVLSDAFAVYRRLLPRSVAVAGIVFLVVALGDALAGESTSRLANLVSLVLALVGGLLVQGALVEVVRDLRGGRPPAGVRELYDRSRGRLGTLLGASLLYGLGVAFGFVLLVVPGLIAVARWSLIVPLVMIEKLGWREAFARSSALVRGSTGRVLVLVVVSNLITSLIALGVATAFTFLPTFFAILIGGTIAGAVSAPFEAYVLIVLYYRLTEPGRPVLRGSPA